MRINLPKGLALRTQVKKQNHDEIFDVTESEKESDVSKSRQRGTG